MLPRPTLPHLITRAAADLAAVPDVVREPLSTMHAQGMHGLYGYLDWIDRQSSPLLCDEERLIDWANLYDAPRLLATPAEGVAYATGNAGTMLLAESCLRGQNGQNYRVTRATALTQNPTPVPILCEAVGEIGNMPRRQTLSLIDPVIGCDNTLTVGESGVTGGAEDEDVDDWRGRVYDEWRVVVSRGARSGKPEDYIYWAKSAHPSVSGALVQTNALGLGTVLIRPFCNDLERRLPTSAVIEAIKTKLQDLAPATADWRVALPILRPVVFQVAIAPAFDKQETRDAITRALSALVLSFDHDLSTLQLSEINAAILSVTTAYTLHAPTAALIGAAGEIFVFQEVVWS